MSDLLTKEDIARELNPDEPLSIRSVERYIQLAGVKPKEKGKGRGQLSRYTRADADKIVLAYRAAQAEQQAAREGQQTQALERRKADALGRVADVGELARSQSEGFHALASALDSWPMWITKQQAVELAGIPSSYFDRGVRAGELPHIGHGSARRYHRDDLRAFAEKMRAPGFIEGLQAPRK